MQAGTSQTVRAPSRRAKNKLPSPVKTSSENSVTVSEKIGWPSSKVSFWIMAISSRMKPIPSAEK
jgi:hypothetical protein